MLVTAQSLSSSFSRCGQAHISESCLSCVKSVQPASNQPLPPQGNIMWHLSNPSQHVAPPTIILREKRSLSSGSHLFVQSMLILEYFYISTDSFRKSCTEFNLTGKNADGLVRFHFQFAFFSFLNVLFSFSPFCQTASKPDINNVFASKCQPKTLYFCHILILKKNHIHTEMEEQHWF